MMEHGEGVKRRKTESDDLPETFVPGFHEEAVVRRLEFRRMYLDSCVDADADAWKRNVRVSVLGLGGSPFGDLYEEQMSQATVNEIVNTSLKAGINVIDTAYWYGQGKSEERIGKALEGIPRKAFYIHTKCGRYETDVGEMFDFSRERTERAVDDALNRLRVDCIDLMQIHDPEFAPSLEIILNETLPALKKAKDEGKIRAIGLTGYPLSIHKEIIEKSDIKPDACLTYCHYTIQDTSLIDSGFLEFLDEKGIGRLNASPLAMGLLTPRGPHDWHPATPEIKKASKKAIDYCVSEGVSLPKLAIDFSLREKRIPCTFCGAVNMKLLEMNLESARNVGKLSEKEEAILKDIRERFFLPLTRKTWENTEIAVFNEKLKKTQDEGKASMEREND